MIAGLSDYQMTMIMATGQKHKWAYGTYNGVEGHTFTFRSIGPHSFAIAFDDKTLMEMHLNEQYPMKPCVSHPVIDRMLAATAGIVKGIAHYIHNYPIQRMLYEFITIDALRADGGIEYTFHTKNSGDATFVRRGSILRFFGQRTIAMKRFSDDRAYIAGEKFYDIIKANTKPMIKLPVADTFDTVLSLIGALPEHVAPCSDVSPYSFNDVWGTL